MSVESIQQDIRGLEAKIAVAEGKLLKAKCEARKLRRQRRREKYLYKELTNMQKGAAFLRAMQASINVRKMFPDKLKQVNHRISRIKNEIWSMTHNKEVSECYLHIKLKELGKAKPMVVSAEEVQQKIPGLTLLTLKEFEAHRPLLKAEIKVGLFLDE